ncbi:MAG TPA: adenylate/guanylate cyclase domain-containing protein [Alphaproteobacteria bacterium]|nr:adenylate/guanylate cyclase domain-containing protein [Alphaproteobacteria bacterium]
MATSETPSAIEVSAIVDWLIDGTPPHQLPRGAITELCERLVAAGIPLLFGASFAWTLHPNVMGGWFQWTRGRGVRMVEKDFAWLESEECRRSLWYAAADAGMPVRCRLDDPKTPADGGLLDELRGAGATDVIAIPLAALTRRVLAAAWATDRPGGFTEPMIDALGRITRPLGRVVETHVLERLSINLLNTYVGRSAGERVLNGTIRRGGAETISAAIWLSDLRDSTRWAETLPPHDYLALLNDHFDCLVPAIERQGGEVLKYIGDGVLAIFPLETRSRDEACRAALAAEVEARQQTAALNARRAAARVAPIRYGLALHIGEVLYGNIGAANRLDFTAIGPAVNLAARLGALAGELGRDALLSAEFAKHCPEAAEPLGAHSLRGIGRPTEVFGLKG